MLAAAPVAQDDLFYHTPVNTMLTVNATNGVISNDFDADGDTLTATRLMGPGHGPFHGSISFSSNSSFVYTPNQNFNGFDSWEYFVSDGSQDSRPATASVLVGAGLSANLNRDQRISDNLLHGGGLTLTQPLSDGMQLVHRSDNQGKVVVPVDAFASSSTSTSTLTSITAQQTFGGVNQGTVTYSPSTFATDAPMRFAIQAKDMPTGHYSWQMTVTLVISGGNNIVVQYSGSQSVVDNRDSEYGPGWSFGLEDRLHVQSGLPNRPNGAMLVTGAGTTLWFPENLGLFSRAAGDLSFSELTETPDGYLLKDKWGNEKTFNSDGRITSIRPIQHLHTPLYSFDYESSGQQRLTQITDQFNRSMNLNWNTSQRLVVTSFDGNRQTSIPFIGSNGQFTVDQNTSLLIAPLPGMPAYQPPQTTYQTSTSDGINRITELTLPGASSNSSNQTFVYDQFGLLSMIRHHNMGENGDETHTITVHPMLAQGLRPTGWQGSFALHFVSNDNARIIDERGKVSTFTTNRFGEVVEMTNPIGATSLFEFDHYGQLFRHTAPDPDGAGPKPGTGNGDRSS